MHVLRLLPLSRLYVPLSLNKDRKKKTTAYLLFWHKPIMKQSLLLSYIGDSIFSGLAQEQIRKDTVELSIPAKEFFQLKFVAVVVVIVSIFFPWRSKDVLKPVVFPIEQANATVDLHIDLCEAVLLHLFSLFMWTHNHLPSKKSRVVFWLVGIESEVS